MREDGSVPFELLPIDPVKQKVCEVWLQYVGVFAGLWGADQLDLLPFDTTTYSSLAERDKAKEAEARGEAIKPKKPLAEALKRLTAKSASADKVAPESRIDQDESLKRVLGLTQWDAAAELNQKLKAKASADAKELRSKVLESTAHKQVVAAHDEYLVKPVAATKAALGNAVRDAPWVTPTTLDLPLEQLPTLEELYTKSWRISTEDGVSQYIRAHRVRVGPVLRFKGGNGLSLQVAKASKGKVPSFRLTTDKRGTDLLLPSLQVLEGDTSRVPNYARRVISRACDQCDDDDWCRCCPEFSALYNHRVYICKRPATEPVPELADFSA